MRKVKSSGVSRAGGQNVLRQIFVPLLIIFYTIVIFIRSTIHVSVAKCFDASPLVSLSEVGLTPSSIESAGNLTRRSVNWVPKSRLSTFLVATTYSSFAAATVAIVLFAILGLISQLWQLPEIFVNIILYPFACTLVLGVLALGLSSIAKPSPVPSADLAETNDPS